MEVLSGGSLRGSIPKEQNTYKLQAELFIIIHFLRWTFKIKLGLLKTGVLGERYQTNTSFHLIWPAWNAAVLVSKGKRGFFLGGWPLAADKEIVLLRGGFHRPSLSVRHKFAVFPWTWRSIFLGVSQLWLVSCRVVFRFGEGSERTETTCFSRSLSLYLSLQWSWLWLQGGLGKVQCPGLWEMEPSITDMKGP